MKQTSVDFLYEFVQLQLTHEQQMQFEGLFQQAKEIEKAQIYDAYVYGVAYGIDIDKGFHPHSYYNNTFKSE